MVNKQIKKEKIEKLKKLKNKILNKKKNNAFYLVNKKELEKTEKEIEKKLKKLTKDERSTKYNPFDIDEILKNNFKRKNLKFVLKIAMNFLNLKKAY